MSISPVSGSNPYGSIEEVVLREELGDEQEPSQPSTPSQSLRDRVYAFMDWIAYTIYSDVINPPRLMPIEFVEIEYERTLKITFEQEAEPFEVIKERVLNYPQYYQQMFPRMSMERIMQRILSPVEKLQMENIELYSNPEVRKQKAQEYADSGYEGTDFSNDEESLVFYLCKKELHALYRKEPKYLKAGNKARAFIINAHNKGALIKHKREWDRLSPSEKREKVFGKSRNYKIAAAIAVSVAIIFFSHGLVQSYGLRR